MIESFYVPGACQWWQTFNTPEKMKIRNEKSKNSQPLSLSIKFQLIIKFHIIPLKIDFQYNNIVVDLFVDQESLTPFEHTCFV